MEKLYVGLLSCALIVLLHYVVSSYHKQKDKAAGVPPSPPAIPFLGHLHLVKQPLHAALTRLAARHGPVFSLRLGSCGAVVVSSAACAKECFTEHDVALADRPRIPSWRFVSMDYSMLAATSYGPHWRTLRRVAAEQLLSAHRVGCMSGVISGEVRAMVRRLYRSATATPRVQLRSRLFEVSLSVLMETIAHTKATPTTATSDEEPAMSFEAQEFRKIVDEINPHVGMANLYWDYLPLLRWLDIFGTRNKVLGAVSRRDAFLQRLIDAERQKQGSEGGGDDGQEKSMISVMFTLQKKQPQVYTDTMIRGLCASLFSAGTETTLAAIEWAMSLLLNHPTVLRKAQAELDQLVGTSRLVAAEDLPLLTYLHCIINETLRLYSSAPLLLPHQSSADCKIGGYKILSGTMVIVNVYAINRDPSMWKDPMEFRPERFEDGKAEGLFLIPFGMGRRKCPGEAMALRTIGLVLAALIQCFDWGQVDAMKVDMTEGGEEFISPKAIPFEAVCKPRAAMCDVLKMLQ